MSDCGDRMAMSATKQWRIVPGSPRGQWLVADRGVSVWVVAPPGTPLAGDHSEDDLGYWRCASWLPDVDHVSLALSAPVEDSWERLTAFEVCAATPSQYHPWVRGLLEKRLVHALAFAAREGGQAPHEGRARAAAQVVSELRDEARQAFPDQGWYEAEAATIPTIPSSPERLLRAVAQASAGRQPGLQHRLLRICRGVARRALVRLPSSQQRWARQRLTNRRLRHTAVEPCEVSPPAVGLGMPSGRGDYGKR